MRTAHHFRFAIVEAPLDKIWTGDGDEALPKHPRFVDRAQCLEAPLHIILYFGLLSHLLMIAASLEALCGCIPAPGARHP